VIAVPSAELYGTDVKLILLYEVWSVTRSDEGRNKMKEIKEDRQMGQTELKLSKTNS
jgi:hypothetical protein